MLSYPEALAAIAHHPHGEGTTPAERAGLVALAYTLSGFGYHFATEDDTDHNWSGESGRDAQEVCQGRVGNALGHGPYCYKSYPDDDTGIEALFLLVDAVPPLGEALHNAEADAVTNALYAPSVLDGTTVAGGRWRDAILQQIPSPSDFETVFVKSLADLARTTGPTGWTRAGLPVAPSPSPPGPAPGPGPGPAPGPGPGPEPGPATPPPGPAPPQPSPDVPPPAPPATEPEPKKASGGSWLVGSLVALTAVGLVWGATHAKG